MFKIFHSFIVVTILIGIMSCGGGSSSGSESEMSPNDDTPENLLGTMKGQVLLGPIVGASVAVYDSSALEMPPICTVTSSEQGSPDGPGIIDMTPCSIESDTLYYLIVHGGEDIDVDDDGVNDATPTPKTGALHALITGQEMIAGDWRINILTEIAYQNALDVLISNPDPVALLDKRNNTAQLLLSVDLNNDGVIDGYDLLKFLPQDHFDSLVKPDAALINSILSSIHNGNALDTKELSRQYLLAAIGYMLYDDSYFSGYFNLDYIYENGYLFMAGAAWDESSTIIDDLLAIRVYNVSDPSNITLAGELDITELNTDLLSSGIELKKSGDYLYIAAGSAGLVVVDVADPEAPGFVANYHNGDSVNSIEIGNSYAFISTYLGDISILDISTPTAPSFISSVSVNAFNMLYRNNRLYVYGTGVSILDVTNPASVSVLDNLSFPSGSGHNIKLSGDFLFIPSSEEGQQIRVFDISDESNISQVYQIAVPGYIFDIEVDGNRLYTSMMSMDNDSSLNTYQIMDSGNLELVDSRSGLNTRYIAVGGGNVYLSDPKELNIYRKEALAQAVSNVASIDTLYLASGVQVSNELSYVADGSRLVIYDINDPLTGISEVGSLQLIDQIYDFQVVGDLAYIANSTEGFVIADISDPETPVFVVNENTANYDESGVSSVTSSIAISGNYAFTTIDNIGKLIVFDILNPDSPAPVGLQLDIGTFTYKQVVYDNYLYLVGSDGLEIINIQDPLNIVHEGIIYLYASDLEIENDIGYLSSINGGIYVLDFSDKITPAIISEVDGLGSASAITVVNQIAYVANKFGFIGVYDVTDLSNPVYITQYKVNGLVNDVSVSNDYIFVTNGFGLVVENAVKNIQNLD